MCSLAITDCWHLLAQVYAISGADSNNTCSVRVMHAGLVVESLFKSPANYHGVTGLWSIPFAPADASSAVIIISFASGSRAMTAGAASGQQLFIAGRSKRPSSAFYCSVTFVGGLA